MSNNNSDDGCLVRLFGLGFIFLIIFLISKCNGCNNSNEESDKAQTNHEIHTNEFDNPNSNDKSSTNTNDNPATESDNSTATTPYVPPVDPVTQDSLDLISQGYESTYIRNGDEPDCFNYTPQVNNEIDNKLIVEVGGGTDVAIKIMSYRTGKCVRYFFVNSGSTYTVRHIPEGRYYLKIGYGKQWMMSRESGQCKGKFLRNATYEKGDDVMDFNIIYHGNSYQIPSFQLRLDVIATDVMSSFDSENISEEQFNK